MATFTDLKVRSSTSHNTGNKGTRIEFDKILGVFLSPLDFVIDSTDLATQLTNAGKAADPNDRIYALGTFSECEDKSSDTKRISFGYGEERPNADGTVAFKLIPGDIEKTLQKIYRTFNGQHKKFKLWCIDDQNGIWHTKSNAGANTGFGLGYIWTDKKGVNTGEGVKSGIEFGIKNVFEWDNNSHRIDAGFDVLEAIGSINNITLEVATALAAGVVDLYISSNDGADNLVDDYQAELIAGTTAFAPTVATSGAAITVSTVAAATINGRKAIRVTMTTGLPSSGQDLIMKMAPTATLLGLGIAGYENPPFTPYCLTLTV